jgi:alcohol oxidase
MDTLRRGKESVLQGKHVPAIFRITFTAQEILEHLAQWEINGNSLVAQKLVQNLQYWCRIDWHFSGSEAKIKWRPDDDELKAMGSAFQPRWKEFFQDRPDKAVAIFSVFEGCVHIILF